MAIAFMTILVIAVVGSIGTVMYFGSSSKTTGGTTYTPTTITGSCPAPTTLAGTISVAYPDFTQTPIKLTLVASQTVNYYAQSPTPATTPSLASATSSSSAPVAISSTAPQCGVDYMAISGDGSTYFHNATNIVLSAQNNGQGFTIVLPRYSAPTLTFANFSGTAGLATTRIHSAVASTPYTAYLYLKAGVYTDSEGQGLISLAYNGLDLNIKDVGGESAASPQGGAPTISFVTTNAVYGVQYLAWGVQNKQTNYYVPSASNGQYTTTTGTSVGSAFIPIDLNTQTSFAVNELIAVQFSAADSYFNTTSGSFKPGFYVNPVTGANLFTPVVTYNGVMVSTN